MPEEYTPCVFDSILGILLRREPTSVVSVKHEPSPGTEFSQISPSITNCVSPLAPPRNRLV